MKDQRVEYQTANLAKEKGFNEECDTIYTDGIGMELYKLAYYEGGGETINSRLTSDYFSKEGILCTAPTQSLLAKWLREIHNINISIDYQGTESDSMEYCYIIKYLPTEFTKAKRWVTHIEQIESGQFHVNNTYSGFFETYEKALEGALVEGLKLIKDEKQREI